MVNAISEDPLAEPLSESRPPSPPVSVCGKRVAELNILISPAAFVVARSDGNHEFTRLFYPDRDGKICAGHAGDRVGPLQVLSYDWDPMKGLTVHMTKGYCVLVPASRCQVTYQS